MIRVLILYLAVSIVAAEVDQGALEPERFALLLTFSVDVNKDDRAAARTCFLSSTCGPINDLNVLLQLPSNQVIQSEFVGGSSGGGSVRPFAAVLV